MDANAYSVFLSQNRETIADFVKLKFDVCKREVRNLGQENNEMRSENKLLQNSIEFCHNQTNNPKRRNDELLNKFSTS